MKFYILSIILFVLGSNLNLQSQVTIGSDLEPAKGSLLDLKEFSPTPENVTSTKGLALPRVTLRSLTGALNETLGLDTPLDADMHTGLLIFNYSDSQCPEFPSGVYVWNRNAWVPIGVELPKDHYSETMNTENNIGTLTDYEGNVYSTKRFKVLATDGSVTYDRVWMTQNLRSLKDSLGNWIDCPAGLYFNPAYYLSTQQGVKVTTKIPDGIVGDYSIDNIPISGQTYVEFVTEYGLGYTVDQAKRSCPQGWHLPTNQEWLDFFNNYGGLSSAGDIIKKNSGKQYISADNKLARWGASATENGFNVVPTGYVLNADIPKTNYFGQHSLLIGVDVYFSINSNSEIGSNAPLANRRYSVRCIKNE